MIESANKNKGMFIKMHNLNNREKLILQLLITIYIKTAEPVGSRTLSKCDIQLSSATVRNVLIDLEEKGYLLQPYTSAGRMPTDKAYRYYINDLMGTKNLNNDIKKSIKNTISKECLNVNGKFKSICELLSNIASQIAFIIEPQVNILKLKAFKMVNFDNNNVTFIFIFNKGIVKNITIKLLVEIKLDKLVMIENNLSGYLRNEVLLFDDLIKLNIFENDNEIKNLFNDIINVIKSDLSIHFYGLGTMLNKPEFVEMGKVQFMLNLLETKTQILEHLVLLNNKNRLVVKIGGENLNPLFEDLGVILKTYNIDGGLGQIGIIAPKRMEYSYLMPLINYISKELNKEFKK